MSLPKYDFAFIDAQYYLVRNASMLNKTDDIIGGAKFLATLFYQTIMKFKNEKIDFGKPILCWDMRDNGVYYKSKLLPGYKDDRESIIDTYMDIIDQVESGDNSEATMKKLSSAKQALDLFKIRELAKKYVLATSNNLGMPSLCLKGYEADDWACILSNKIMSTPERKAVLMTVDGDWKFLAYHNIDYYQTKRDIVYKYDDLVADEPWCECSFYESKILDELFNKSHNNVTNPLKGIPSDHALSNFDKILNEYSLGYDHFISLVPEEIRTNVENAFSALDIVKSCPELIGVVDSVLYTSELNPKVICNFEYNRPFNTGIEELKDWLPNFNPSKLKKFIDGLDKTLYSLEELEVSPLSFNEFFGCDAKEEGELVL